MKSFLTEIAMCTIVSAAATLLFYIMRLDQSWQEAATTFGTCFLVMFALGLVERYRKNQQN